MNEDDLYTIFSEYAGVKKAWLQRYRANIMGDGSPPHNHRGFGFVIFYDSLAVDQLIGANFSKFVNVRDGARLEVKRAVSSTDMGSQAVDHAIGANYSKFGNVRDSARLDVKRAVTSNDTGPQV